MGKHGGNYKEWYVSTSINPKMELNKYHKIKNGDKGLMRTAESEIRSAEISEFFTDLGAKGDSGIKDDAVCVYAFKMDKHTRPNR